MSNLNDLGTTPLQDEVDVDKLPEQMGGYSDPPQPGTYRFELPVLKPEAFKKVVTEKFGDRVQVKFDNEAPLKIVQAPPAMADEFLGTPFTCTLSNVPRKRGKGDNAPMASDWDYLNRALGEKVRPANNRGYADMLIAQSVKSPKVTFQADVEWSWQCNDKRDARFDDGAGQSTVVPMLAEDGVTPVLDAEGQPRNVQGCGARIYQKDVPKVNGKYPRNVTCPQCQASVRGFPNLVRFEK